MCKRGSEMTIDEALIWADDAANACSLRGDLKQSRAIRLLVLAVSQGTPPGLEALVIEWQRTVRLSSQSGNWSTSAAAAVDALLAWVPPGGQESATEAERCACGHSLNRHWPNGECKVCCGEPCALAPRETARKDGA